MNYIDLHCDTILELFEHRDFELARSPLCVDIDKLKAAGSLAQFFACFIDGKAFDMDYDKGYLRIYEMLDLMKEKMSAAGRGAILPALSAKDLKDNESNGAVSAFFTVEEGGVLNGHIERLDELYSAGIRLITLMWNYDNCIGHANSSDPDAMKKGLTDFGFEAVERMNELGILVDISHASDGSFWDVIKTSRVPVLASHSNARALCAHQRNLTDEMLKALGDKGGVAGLNFYPLFVNGTEAANVYELADHARHMADCAGVEAVAIGSDFDGFEGGLAGLESADKIDNLGEALRIKGFSQKDIDKIFYENALRLIWDVL